MIVLGINEAHNSSAALAIDGEIVAAAQEERFSRQKPLRRPLSGYRLLPQVNSCKLWYICKQSKIS